SFLEFLHHRGRIARCWLVRRRVSLSTRQRDMQRQHHETLLDRPMAEIFSALVGVVGHGRWGGGLLGAGGDVLPAGTRYEQQRGSVLRRGRVVERTRPVSIT